MDEAATIITKKLQFLVNVLLEYVNTDFIDIQIRTPSKCLYL